MVVISFSGEWERKIDYIKSQCGSAHKFRILLKQLLDTLYNLLKNGVSVNMDLTTKTELSKNTTHIRISREKTRPFLENLLEFIKLTPIYHIFKAKHVSNMFDKLIDENNTPVYAAILRKLHEEGFVKKIADKPARYRMDKDLLIGVKQFLNGYRIKKRWKQSARKELEWHDINDLIHQTVSTTCHPLGTHELMPNMYFLDKLDEIDPHFRELYDEVNKKCKKDSKSLSEQELYRSFYT